MLLYKNFPCVKTITSKWIKLRPMKGKNRIVCVDEKLNENRNFHKLGLSDDSKTKGWETNVRRVEESHPTNKRASLSSKLKVYSITILSTLLQ